MCSPTPHSGSGAASPERRVVEDPEQDHRVGGELPVEPPGVEPERRAPIAAHHAVAERGEARRASRAPRREARRDVPGTGSAPCRGTPATTRGSSGGSSAPKYRPSLRSGAPLVSSPPTGNHPRHAHPPCAIAICSFSASASAKKSRASASSRVGAARGRRRGPRSRRTRPRGTRRRWPRRPPPRPGPRVRGSDSGETSMTGGSRAATFATLGRRPRSPRRLRHRSVRPCNNANARDRAPVRCRRTRRSGTERRNQGWRSRGRPGRGRVRPERAAADREGGPLPAPPRRSRRDPHARARRCPRLRDDRGSVHPGRAVPLPHRSLRRPDHRAGARRSAARDLLGHRQAARAAGDRAAHRRRGRGVRRRALVRARAMVRRPRGSPPGSRGGWPASAGSTTPASSSASRCPGRVFPDDPARGRGVRRARDVPGRRQERRPVQPARAPPRWTSAPWCRPPRRCWRSWPPGRTRRR